VSPAQRATHDHFVFLGFELRVFALKQFQDVLRDFVAHIDFEPIVVTAESYLDHMTKPTTAGLPVASHSVSYSSRTPGVMIFFTA
jgi:hypothetical protein